MINEITTVYTYALNGADTFLIPFEYLARKFVAVTLIGKDRKLLTINKDYTFVSPNKIMTTKVWTSADGYNLIEIRRYTSATEKLVNFIDGTILRSDDLNTSQIQVLHIAAEARDLSADTIGTNEAGNLDARGRRIVNVADPVEDGDVVPLRVVKSWDNSALNSANVAHQNADWAHYEAERAVNASNSAVAAQGVVLDAERHVTVMEKTIAQNTIDVITAKDNVQKLEASATSSANNAKIDADRAFNEANRAKTEADKLANNNALAAAVNYTEPASGSYNGAVYWKANQISPAVVAQHKLNIGYGWDGSGEVPTFDFNFGKNIWCGNLITNSDRTISFTGMAKITMQCDLTTNHLVTQYHNVNGGWKINAGEFRNRSGSYLIADIAHSYNNNTYFQTHGINLTKGMGNDSQSSYYFLEDNGKGRIAQIIKVLNGDSEGNFAFSHDGFSVYAPRILIEAYNQTTILHPDGNIQSTSGLWDGGYLKTHINRLRDDLNKRIDDLNKRVDDLTSSINSRFTALEGKINSKIYITNVYLSKAEARRNVTPLDNGEVVCGTTTQGLWYARTIMIQLSDGTIRAITSQN